ncbi:hypothetical protein ABK040_011539 [Willaertia magna]
MSENNNLSTTTTTNTNTSEEATNKNTKQQQSNNSSSKKKSNKNNNAPSSNFIAQQITKRIKENKGGVKVIQKKSTTTNKNKEQQDDGDYSDTENEPKSEYRKGGYHPIEINDILNDKFIIVSKLGWGYYSTVWLCFDLKLKTFRALKIQKSSKDFLDAALDEIKILNFVMDKYREINKIEINENNILNIYKELRIVALFETFYVRGINGTHMTMTFEVMGNNLLKLIEQYNYKGIPLDKVKIIMKDILIGLHFLHYECKIIHTDIKPENILVEQTTNKIKQIMNNYNPNLDINLPLEERDLSTLNDKQIKKLKQKYTKAGNVEEIKKLEEKLEQIKLERMNSNNEIKTQKEEEQEEKEEKDLIDLDNIRVKIADFGNACFLDKKISNEIQTRQYRSPEVIVGAKYSFSADIWSAACMAFELATGEFLFDPKQGKTYSRDEDHLALMSELLGEIPLDLIRRGNKGSKYFTMKGEFLHIKKLKPCSLYELLLNKYQFSEYGAKEFSEFLLPMLEIMPEKRMSARDLLNHPFLKDTTVPIDK